MDAALWLREPLGEDDHLDMISLVAGALHRDDVDVVVMNRAKLTLISSVLKGRLLVEKDEAFRVRTEARLMSKVHDRWYYIQRHLQEFSRDVIERGLA